MAEVGQSYLYAGSQGVGEAHAEGVLHPEMRDLDLRPDTAVTVVGVDEDRGGLVLLEWTDSSGNQRITSVEPDLLTERFIPAAAEGDNGGEQ